MNQQRTLHIAVIPDGNRRWARRRGLALSEGHIAGARTAKEVGLSPATREMGITHFTFWGSSKDNLFKRPIKERMTLFSLSEKYFGELLDEANKRKIRVRILGEWKKSYPSYLRRIFEELISSTEKYRDFHATFLLAYDGREEMVDAVKKLRSVSRITQETVKKYLWTGELPPVDLLIRTGSGSEPHNSAGFMMWQTAYSQLYFTDTFWPDFSIGELRQVVQKFLKTERRFGK